MKRCSSQAQRGGEWLSDNAVGGASQRKKQHYGGPLASQMILRQGNGFLTEPSSCKGVNGGHSEVNLNQSIPHSRTTLTGRSHSEVRTIKFAGKDRSSGVHVLEMELAASAQ